MSKSKAVTKRNTVTMTPLEHQTAEYGVLGGSRSDDFNRTVADQALSALWMPEAFGDDAKLTKRQAALATLQGIKPRDEVEGMLAAQMVACHSAAMECYRRAMIPDQPHVGRESNLRFADKLSKTYAQQMEALKRHRQKADQTVRVERVIVSDGGQAIVGNVTKGGE
jgi:hypothetical protein